MPVSPLYITPVPEAAKQIHFILRGFNFEGVTVFRPPELHALYKAYVGKDVTLEITWKVADALTKEYRKKGYFLSRAFVPAQEVDHGIPKIQVIEGYIGGVSLTLTGSQVMGASVIHKAIAVIKGEIPVNIKTLESQLLLLNDLPGLSFQATMEPLQDRPAAHLIRQREENLTGRFSLDFHDSDINILKTVLNRDRIRAAQLGVNYDKLSL